MLWIQGLNLLFLIKGRGEMAVEPAVTAVLLNQSVLDTGTEGNVVSTG